MNLSAFLWPSSPGHVFFVFFFLCLLGWQLLLLEFYGMWQQRTPFSPGACQADRGLTPEHPALICGRSATAGSYLSHAASDRAMLWLQTHQGWPAAVNTFVLRQQVHCHQCLYATDKKSPHTKNPSTLHILFSLQDKFLCSPTCLWRRLLGCSFMAKSTAPSSDCCSHIWIT